MHTHSKLLGVRFGFLLVVCAPLRAACPHLMLPSLHVVTRRRLDRSIIFVKLCLAFKLNVLFVDAQESLPRFLP